MRASTKALAVVLSVGHAGGADRVLWRPMRPHRRRLPVRAARSRTPSAPPSSHMTAPSAARLLERSATQPVESILGSAATAGAANRGELLRPAGPARQPCRRLPRCRLRRGHAVRRQPRPAVSAASVVADRPDPAGRTDRGSWPRLGVVAVQGSAMRPPIAYAGTARQRPIALRGAASSRSSPDQIKWPRLRSGIECTAAQDRADDFMKRSSGCSPISWAAWPKQDLTAPCVVLATDEMVSTSKATRSG